MSDLLTNLSGYSPVLVPFVFFLFGLTSSVHCVGMCGPLSLLAGNGKQSSWRYQIGRLMGYLTIGTALSFVGQATLSVLLAKIGVWFWYFLAIFVMVATFALIFKRFQWKAPAWWERVAVTAAGFAVKQRNPSLKAFLMGVSSVFLPCGVLYLALISLVSFSSPIVTASGIVTFWMGTVPLLHFGLPWLKQRMGTLSYRIGFFKTAIILVLCVLVLASRYPEIKDTLEHHCH